MATYDAGIVTAYGAAVRGGYTGTYEQFCAQQANYAQTAAAVEQAKTDAQAAAQRAQDVADSIPEDYTELTEEVGDLKDDLSSMQTATASDVGKALKAKTVTNGKVSAWEFGDAGGANVEVIDGTLYIDGVAQSIEGVDGVGITNIAKTGTSGLVDTYTITMTDGTTYTFTVTNGDASDAKIQQFIGDWLDDHPEATTTVQDGAITMPKLSADVKSQLGTRANHNYLYNAEQAEGTATFIELFQKVKNEVMDEYRGNMNKIPIIITTDQHGRLSGRANIFEAINSCVNWYDVSKFFNLGDSVSIYYGTYTTSTDELTTSNALEAMITALSPIPMDKQVNLFGNHDTWCGKSGETGYKMLPQNLLAPYFRNAQGHRMSNAGYFSLKDDYFNVKYVIVSGFEYIDGVGVNVGTESASTEQISWLIKELSEDDGYDIVMVCHEPLFPDWAGRSFESQLPPGDNAVNNSNRWAWLNTDDIFLARKNKTSGSFTDRSGVVHTYDFSGMTGNLLCGIDGHLHYDCSQYTGNDEFLCESFGPFKDDQGGFLYFVLIDRDNEQLNVWKMSHTRLIYEHYQVPFYIPEAADTFSIKRRLKNTRTYQISRTIREGQSFFDIVSPSSSSYTVGYVKVLMGGVDVTSTYYDLSTRAIFIPSVTGDIDITAFDTDTSADTVVWTVTNSFVNAKSNKPVVYSDEYYEKPICVDNGSSFSETINPTANHNIYDISVAMGNIDITSSLTSIRATVKLSIASVSGDINVICKACEISHVQGLLSDTGDVDASQTSWVTTSFVPIDGSTVGSITCDPAPTNQRTYIAFYDENHRFINRVYSATISSVVYVASNARYVRVSMEYVSRPEFFALPNKTITNASVSVTADGMTLGEYPSTIKRGDRLTIPYTKDVDGTVIVDSCTAGGSNVACTVTEDSIVIPYTPGDVVVTAHIKTRVLYELASETTLTATTLDTGVKPASTAEDAFCYMVDYTIDATTANGILILNTSATGSDGTRLLRPLSGVNTLYFRYAKNAGYGMQINGTYAVGTRVKIVLVHEGGSSNVTMTAYTHTEGNDIVTTTQSDGTAGRKKDSGNLTLGSANATITYHSFKALSVVPTAEEINAFLAFE